MMPTPNLYTSAICAERIQGLKGLSLMIRQTCRVLYASLLARGLSVDGFPREKHYTEDDCAEVQTWSTLAAISMPNHVWFYMYGIALCERYTMLHPKGREHAGQVLIEWIGRHPLREGIPHPHTAACAA